MYTQHGSVIVFFFFWFVCVCVNHRDFVECGFWENLGGKTEESIKGWHKSETRRVGRRIQFFDFEMLASLSHLHY